MTKVEEIEMAIDGSRSCIKKLGKRSARMIPEGMQKSKRKGG